MPPSPIILIISYWLMRTPGCGCDATGWMPVPPSEPGVLGGVPGVLPGLTPLGDGHGADADVTAEARRLNCTHVLSAGKITSLRMAMIESMHPADGRYAGSGRRSEA